LSVIFTDILHIKTPGRTTLPFLPDPDIAADPALAATFTRVEVEPPEILAIELEWHRKQASGKG
jgi:hypothetical protein